MLMVVEAGMREVEIEEANVLRMKGEALRKKGGGGKRGKEKMVRRAWFFLRGGVKHCPLCTDIHTGPPARPTSRQQDYQVVRNLLVGCALSYTSLGAVFWAGDGDDARLARARVAARADQNQGVGEIQGVIRPRRFSTRREVLRLFPTQTTSKLLCFLSTAVCSRPATATPPSPSLRATKGRAPSPSRASL